MPEWTQNNVNIPPVENTNNIKEDMDGQDKDDLEDDNLKSNSYKLKFQQKTNLVPDASED